MCGIAGEIGPHKPRPMGFYDGILQTMARRGPDQEGLHAATPEAVSD